MSGEYTAEYRHMQAQILHRQKQLVVVVVVVVVLVEYVNWLNLLLSFGNSQIHQRRDIKRRFGLMRFFPPRSGPALEEGGLVGEVCPKAKNRLQKLVSI